MRLRALAVTTALALAATGLTACTSKIGLAATVGDHRISLKTVDSYINPSGPTAAARAQQGGSVAPRELVVNTLIRRQLLLDALKQTKQGVPSTKTVRSKYNDAVSQISQGQAAGGAAFDKALNDQILALGFRKSFTQTYVEAFELESVLIDQAGAKSGDQLLAAIAKTHDKVSVSPRFGTWDAAHLSLSGDTKAGIPSFVTIGPDTQTTAAPVAGQ